MKQFLIRLVRIYFGIGAVCGGLGILSYVWGGGNSGRLQRFHFGRWGAGLCGLWRGRQDRRLAAVIDPLVARGIYISAMASARPLHDLRNFAMTPNAPRDPNQLASRLSISRRGR
jgi:hypothetical protein